MFLQTKLINKLTYKLKLTPQMKLSLNLLQMPMVKLKEFIAQQIEENPLLVIENLDPLQKPKEADKELPLAPNYNSRDEEKQNYRESLITSLPTIGEYLMEQLRLATEPGHKRKIGELIIGNIDNNGYLRDSLENIAKSAKTTISKVEKVLFLIQTFEPVGVGARDLRECLLLQLKAKGQENLLEAQIVDKYLPYLEKRRFDDIAKNLSISTNKVKDAIKEIAKLEPKPGCAINRENPRYIIPDAILRKNKRKYEVILNDWELPRITLNEKYKNMIRQKNTSPEVREYLIGRLKASQALINAVNMRKDTIKKVIESIIHIQKDFFDKGTGNFKPMTLDQIAKRTKKHKSTVSRALTNKYLQTPWGIYEIRYFLNCGVKQINGEFLSSKTIKSKIRELIENEKKDIPLSDQNIVKNLKQSDISISRRTVAKYRNQLGILSSKLRS